MRGFGDLDAATARIADELSKQYYLGYNNAGKKDGRWHAIRWKSRIVICTFARARIRRIIVPASSRHGLHRARVPFWIALGLSVLGGLGGLLVASGVLLIHDSLRARS